jgi:hypothetical protein
MWVEIVDDPIKGLTEGNAICHEGKGIPCKHLRGDKPGEYWCAVHDESWYKDTPCFAYTQVESSPNDVCRMGKFVLEEYDHEETEFEAETGEETGRV